MIRPSNFPAGRPAYRSTPCGANHPLSVDQVYAAIRHAQRQGEPCYAIMPAYSTGAYNAAAFTTERDFERVLAGTEPWPGSCQPGLYSGPGVGSSRIFSVNATGLVCEVTPMRF